MLTEEIIMKMSFSPPDITKQEIKAVSEVLRSGWITTGRKVKELEQSISRYCGTARTVCLNSATACMELALRILGVGEGDEVITSAYTYTASASVINHVGAKIVLVDTAKDSYEMDYDALGKLINHKTKVIIPVDIAGMMCDYDKLFSVIEKYKEKFIPTNKYQQAIGRIAVLADAAHSFGATYRGQPSGIIADFTSFSFHAVKNLTTAEGGAITWKTVDGVDDDDIYTAINLLSLHGQSKDALTKLKKAAWEYDIISFAYKFNMTDIAAAIGQVQLERYGAMLKKRKELIGVYMESLEKCPKLDIMPHSISDSERVSSGHLFLTRIKKITLEERQKIIIALADKGIPTNVHYKPLPMHTAYREYGFDIANYPNAYNQYANEITLPLHTLLKTSDVKYVATKYLEILKDY